MLPLLVSQVLSLSQAGCHDDVTIVILQYRNSIVLTAMFPVIRCILETPVLYDESGHHDSRFDVLRFTDHLGSKVHESQMLKTICLCNYKNIKDKIVFFIV